MRSNEQAHNRGKAVSKQQLSPSPTHGSGTLAQQNTHPAIWSQRTPGDPRSLTPADVLQLQRTLGNQVVVRRLAGMKRLQQAANSRPDRQQIESVIHRAPKVPQSKEYRPPELKNEKFDWGETKVIHDPFDQTLTMVLPDGSGWQLTYIVENKEGDPQAQETHIKYEEKLTPLRVQALGFMDASQGTFQEDEAGRDWRKDRDAKFFVDWAAQSPANSLEFTAYATELVVYNASMEQYREALRNYPQLIQEARKKGQKPPPPPVAPVAPKAPAGRRKTTRCNQFPADMLKAITGESKGLGGMDPSRDPPRKGEKLGSQRAAWRTLDMQPEGPKPGDICSLATPGSKGLPDDGKHHMLMHVGVFKSKRPGPNGTEIWTFVDGGQGGYEGLQQVGERTRYFDPKTEILSTKLADAGQNAGDRWLRGWLDLDAHVNKSGAAQ